MNASRAKPEAYVCPRLGACSAQTLRNKGLTLKIPPPQFSTGHNAANLPLRIFHAKQKGSPIRMRSSLVTLSLLIGSFFAVATLSPKLFQADLPTGQLSVLSTPQPVREVSFQDAAGNSLTLADFRGSYLFVNVWATWCEPCREEMPSLDALARSLKGYPIRVLPISVDVTGIGTVERFYKRNNLRDLPAYSDPGQSAMRALTIFGIPSSMLIGPDGRELGRMTGPAHWDRPEAMRQLLELTGTQARPDARNGL